MRKLSKQEACSRTADTWDWVSEHPLESKENSPALLKNNPVHYCFCCEYAIQQINPEDHARIAETITSMDDTICETCPMLKFWNQKLNPENSIPCLRGEYGSWLSLFSYKNVAQLSDAEVLHKKAMWAAAIAKLAKKAAKSHKSKTPLNPKEWPNIFIVNEIGCMLGHHSWRFSHNHGIPMGCKDSLDETLRRFSTGEVYGIEECQKCHIQSSRINEERRVLPRSEWESS